MSTVAENLFPAGFDLDAPVSEVGWLDSRRADAFQRFRTGGIPHRRIEEWKYSDLRNALEASRKSATILRAPTDPFAAIVPTEIVIRNGRLGSQLDHTLHGIELLDLCALGDDAPDWVKCNL